MPPQSAAVVPVGVGQVREDGIVVGRVTAATAAAVQSEESDENGENLRFAAGAEAVDKEGAELVVVRVCVIADDPREHLNEAPSTCVSRKRQRPPHLHVGDGRRRLIGARAVVARNRLVAGAPVNNRPEDREHTGHATAVRAWHASDQRRRRRRRRQRAVNMMIKGHEKESYVSDDVVRRRLSYHAPRWMKTVQLERVWQKKDVNKQKWRQRCTRIVERHSIAQVRFNVYAIAPSD